MKNKDSLHILLLLINILSFSSKSCLAKFVVQRNKDTSDKLIALDGESIDKYDNAFKSDGTCFDTNKHIASDFGSKTIKCYTKTALNGLGNGE